MVGCRRSLVDGGGLRKPTDDGAGFFKNTLRRLSSKKMDRYRAEALANEQGEVYKGFSHAYWAFAKASLTQTLTAMTSEQDEAQATEVFHLILTYAGLVQTNKGGSSDQWYHLQNVTRFLFHQVRTYTDLARRKTTCSSSRRC